MAETDKANCTCEVTHSSFSLSIDSSAMASQMWTFRVRVPCAQIFAVNSWLEDNDCIVVDKIPPSAEENAAPTEIQPAPSAPPSISSVLASFDSPRPSTTGTPPNSQSLQDVNLNVGINVQLVAPKEAASTPPRPPPLAFPSTLATPPRPSTHQVVYKNRPICQCKQEMVLHRVQSGPNKDRLQLKCRNRKGGCDAHPWAQDAVNYGIPKCSQCSSVTKEFTKKEGPNKDKAYYKCTCGPRGTWLEWEEPTYVAMDPRALQYLMMMNGGLQHGQHGQQAAQQHQALMQQVMMQALTLTNAMNPQFLQHHLQLQQQAPPSVPTNPAHLFGGMRVPPHPAVPVVQQPAGIAPKFGQHPASPVPVDPKPASTAPVACPVPKPTISSPRTKASSSRSSFDLLPVRHDPLGRVIREEHIAMPYTKKGAANVLRTRRVGGKGIVWSFMMDLLMDPSDSYASIIQFTGNPKWEFEFEVIDREAFVCAWSEYNEFTFTTQWVSIIRSMRKHTTRGVFTNTAQSKGKWAFLPPAFDECVTYSIEEVRKRVAKHCQAPLLSDEDTDSLLDDQRSEGRTPRSVEADDEEKAARLNASQEEQDNCVDFNQENNPTSK